MAGEFRKYTILQRYAAREIYPTMEGDDAELWGPDSRVSITGASGSGKTTFVLKTLSDPRMKMNRIIWLAPPFSCRQKEISEAAQKGYIGAKKDGKSFLLIPAEPGWPELVEKALQEGESIPKAHQILVMDDMMQETGRGDAEKLFTAMWISGRHRRCGIWELGHRCFPNQAAKIHKTNAEMFVLFRMGCQDEVATLLRQICPQDWKRLAAVYDDIIEQNTHGFLLIDLRHHKLWPELKYRTGSIENCIILAPEPEAKQKKAPKARKKAADAEE